MAIEKALELKRALILGISGQDGYYLAKFLLNNSYQILGTTRNLQTIPEETSLLISKNCEILSLDIRNTHELKKVITNFNPDEIYNLSGVSSVAYSFNNKEETLETNTYAVIRLLEYLKSNHSTIRFYQASSSEMYGRAMSSPQDELTPLNPVSPYGTSKALTHNACQRFRADGMFIACGILYNHESPLRPINFVTRKISQSVARIRLGIAESFNLGALDARRDWGFAGDYVKAMWKMLQIDTPDNFVIASGETHSVLNFVETSLKLCGLTEKPEKYLITDGSLLRPTDIAETKGNPEKANQLLDWHATVTFENLVRMMVRHDLELLAKEWNKSLEGIPAMMGN